MKAPAITEPLFARNSDGKLHRAPIETIFWIDSAISLLKQDLAQAQKDEERSGYDIDRTMERVEKEGQLLFAHYVKQYLENRDS